MSFKLSELLNPAPAPVANQSPPPPQPVDNHPQTQSPPSQHRRSSEEQRATALPSQYGVNASTNIPVTAYEAADALTALASGNSPLSATATSHHRYPPFPPSPFEQPPSARRYSESRPSSSYGVAAALPVEPSPPIDRTPTQYSPTQLDHYHHTSKSPEQQRRESIQQSRNSPQTKLAPIHSLMNPEGAPFDPVADRPGSSDAPQRSLADASYNPMHNGSRNGSIDHLPPLPPTWLATQAGQAEPRDTNRAETYVANGSLPTGISERFEHMKTEPAGLSVESPAVPSAGNMDGATEVDVQTLSAVADLKNEHGLRKKSREASTPAQEIPTAKPVPKKKAAPKKPPAKKGTASTVKKTATKKRKLEDDDRRSSTPGLKGTKATTKKSQTGTPIGSSPAPSVRSNRDASSPAPSHRSGTATYDDEEDGSGTDGGGVFCFCRGPDDHTPMIACDGEGCDEWYHARCLNMTKDDIELVETFICEPCADKGRGHTIWKRMCRREGCKKPAKIVPDKDGKPSKYCSEECGVLFFADKARLHDYKPAAKKQKKGTARKSSAVEGSALFAEPEHEQTDEDEYEVGPRGGAIRGKEVKALVNAVDDVNAFRRLGDGVLSPPATVSPEQTTFPTNSDRMDIDNHASSTQEPSYTDTESARLSHIATKKDLIRERRQLLKDREKFVSMVREQVPVYAEREAIKIKEFCGYDRRLAWSDIEFKNWRNGDDGVKAFEAGKLSVAAPPTPPQEEEKMDVDGADEEGGEPKEQDRPLICNRKRCQRHAQWQKLVLQDVRFEEADVADEMRRVDREEREIRDRAALRRRESLKGAQMDSAMTEGTVEVVG